MTDDNIHSSDKETKYPLFTIVLAILIIVLLLTAFRCRRRLRSLTKSKTFMLSLVGVYIQKLQWRFLVIHRILQLTPYSKSTDPFMYWNFNNVVSESWILLCISGPLKSIYFMSDSKRNVSMIFSGIWWEENPIEMRQRPSKDFSFQPGSILVLWSPYF